MGWRRGDILLKWSEGHELHGLEIVCEHRPLIDIMSDWLAVEDLGRESTAPPSLKEQVARAEQRAADFAALIISWNYEDRHGNPVEPTAENVLRYCDPAMLASARSAYEEANTRVAPPLSTSSGDGSPPASPAKLPDLPGEWDHLSG